MGGSWHVERRPIPAILGFVGGAPPRPNPPPQGGREAEMPMDSRSGVNKRALKLDWSLGLRRESLPRSARSIEKSHRPRDARATGGFVLSEGPTQFD